MPSFSTQDISIKTSKQNRTKEVRPLQNQEQYKRISPGAEPTDNRATYCDPVRRGAFELMALFGDPVDHQNGVGNSALNGLHG